jgi:hypothetical protein
MLAGISPRRRRQNGRRVPGRAGLPEFFAKDFTDEPELKSENIFSCRSLLAGDSGLSDPDFPHAKVAEGAKDQIRSGTVGALALKRPGRFRL